VSKEELFDFLKDHLSIRIRDNSEPTTCGGECQGYLGVKVMLLLLNPLTGEKELIDQDDCTIG
jgi:hypothetical protein